MTTFRRWTIRLGGLAIFGLVAVVVVYLLLPKTGPIPPATVDFAAIDTAQRQALMDQGQAVARAADCAACHTAEGGPSLAGGLPLETPFGVIFTTNITPSTTQGIGDWTADDLYTAMVWGIGRDGKQLYPAMPYPSYHQITRADIDALWVWLMAQRPVDLQNRPSALRFPFNIRPAIAFWNFAFMSRDTTLPKAEGQSEEWLRGRYLVDVLGHCGECHTPRNLAAATTDQHLQGAVVEHATAPDITATALSARGWTPEDLSKFFRTGLSPQGVMTFNMYPVLEHSSRYLNDQDLAAMVAYLMDGAGPPQPIATSGLSFDGDPGLVLYMGLCAGCHGANGGGVPHGAVPMDTNTTAMLAEPGNLIRIIAEGIPAQALADGESMQEMPGYADRMTADEIADLVNFMRRRWGGQPGDVTPKKVVEYLRDDS